MSLKIIGAGFGRTGTLSTKNALEILGFDKCYHMGELFLNPSGIKYWKELKSTGTTDFEALFEGYEAITDYPGSIFYQELFAAYPDAKVILTVRDPEKWYASTHKTIFGVAPKTFLEKLKMIFRALFNAKLRRLLPVLPLTDKWIWKEKFEGRFEDKEFAIAKFHSHIEEVKRVIPAEQLLIYEVSQAWEPLCQFLEVEVPSVPFPSNNKRENFDQNIETVMKEGKIDFHNA